VEEPGPETPGRPSDPNWQPASRRSTGKPRRLRGTGRRRSTGEHQLPQHSRFERRPTCV